MSLSIAASAGPATAYVHFEPPAVLSANVIAPGASYSVNSYVVFAPDGFLASCTRTAPSGLSSHLCYVKFDALAGLRVHQTFRWDSWGANRTMLVVSGSEPGFPPTPFIDYWYAAGGNFVGPTRLFVPSPHSGDAVTRDVVVTDEVVLYGLSFGSDSDDGIGPNTGEVEVFQRNGSSLAWLQELRPVGLRDNDFFGEAMTAHGDTILVGSPGWDGTIVNSNIGRIYAYERGGTQYQLTQIVEKNFEVPKLFGAYLSLHADAFLVADRDASQNMQLYRRQAAGWTYTRNLTRDVGTYSNYYADVHTADVAVIPGIDLPGAEPPERTMVLDPQRNYATSQYLQTPPSLCGSTLTAPGHYGIAFDGERLLATASCRLADNSTQRFLLLFERGIFQSGFQ